MFHSKTRRQRLWTRIASSPATSATVKTKSGFIVLAAWLVACSQLDSPTGAS